METVLPMARCHSRGLKIKNPGRAALFFGRPGEPSLPTRRGRRVYAGQKETPVKTGVNACGVTSFQGLEKDRLRVGFFFGSELVAANDEGTQPADTEQQRRRRLRYRLPGLAGEVEVHSKVAR